MLVVGVLQPARERRGDKLGDVVMVEAQDGQVEEAAEPAHTPQHVVIEVELAQVDKFIAVQVYDLAHAARREVQLTNVLKVPI